MYSLRKLILSMGTTILTVSAVTLIWMMWPAPVSRQVLDISPAQLQIPAQQDGAGVGSASLGARRVILESPSRMWVGDTGAVRLTLTPVSGSPGSAPFGEYPVSVEAETRLDLPGMSVDPSEPIAGALALNIPAQFDWQVKPDRAGTFRGTTWLHLRFMPRDGSPATTRTISAQPLALSASNILGLPPRRVRLFAYFGIAVGIGLIGIAVTRSEHPRTL